MSKNSKPGRTIITPRPSRIRRDPLRSPAAAAAPDKKDYWQTREWEVRLAVTGVVLFALAIAIVTVGFSAITSGENAESKPWEVRLGDV